MYWIEYSRNGVYRSGHVPKRPARPAPPDQNQWWLVTDSNEPNFVNTAVAKLYSHFKVSNVNKVYNFYEIVLIPFVCCSSRCRLSSYIVNAFMCMRVAAAQSELNEARISVIYTNTHPNTHPNHAYHHVTFLNLYIEKLNKLLSKYNLDDIHSNSWHNYLTIYLFWEPVS